ncbi:MAG: copper chaperone PCu(A)C [Sphingomicrobium sp.]
MAKRVASAALLALLSSCARDQPAPDVAIGHGWTRETAPGQSVAAVYLTVTNHGTGEDRLAKVDPPGGAAASLHSSSSDGGVARMRARPDGLVIPAHSTVELRPGGTHIMVTGLQQPLRAGETIELSLGFDRSGRRPLTVRVVPASGAPDEHGMVM